MGKGKVLILGGGPTGLATGVRLARNGVPTKVIERLPWAGGLCKAYTKGPYKLDLGPHRFTPHNKEVYEFGKEMSGDTLRVVRYRAEILIRGCFVAYPFRLKNLLFKLPPSLSSQLVASYLLASASLGKKHDPNYEAWIKNRFGPMVLKHVFRPLVEKVWGTPLSGLSARFAEQRIAMASLWEIAWEVLTGKRAAKFHSPFYPDNCFLYPKDGYGVMVDRMASEFQKAGGELEVNASVSGIHLKGNKVTTVLYQKDNKEIREEDPTSVITTLPIHHFIGILNPGPTEAMKAAVQSLKTRRLVILYLELNKPQFSENTSLYFPSQEFPFGRMWEQKNHSPDTIPPKDRTVIGIEIPCWNKDEIWNASDEALVEKVIKPMEAVGKLRRDEIKSFFSVHLGWVYPVWDLDYERNLNVLLDFERSIDNLLFNGRPGRFFYNNFHHSVDMGFISANHVLSGKSKSEKWDQDCRVFDEFQLIE